MRIMKESMQILIAETDTKIVNQIKNYLVSFGHKIFPVVRKKFEELLKKILQSN
jgi:hypothetical protein